MRYLLDGFYLLILLILSPWLVYKALTTGKYRRGIWSKFLGSTLDSALSRQHSARSTQHSALTPFTRPLTGHGSLETQHSALSTQHSALSTFPKHSALTAWFHGVSVGEIHLFAGGGGFP